MIREPQVNDYVIWDQGEYGIDEGWIYFVAEESEPKRGWPITQRYVTIEVGVRRKPECEYEKNNPHQNIHILVVCYEPQWKELKFVKRRKSRNDDSIIIEPTHHMYYNEAKQNTHRGQ